MLPSKEEKKHFYLRHNDALMNSTKLSMKAKQSILLSKAENTVNAYESDWDDFVDWCNYQKVSYFPATPETIVNYINDLADYAKANTIARRISAISENYNASGSRENPCMSPLVKQALRGIRRLKGTFQQGKTPILLEDIEDILECIDGSDSPKIQKLRDKAILLIGFMGAFRRSEIAALTVENLKFSPQGLEIFVASSKADQEGQVLTSEFLNELYADLNEKYYGLKKEDNPQIQYEWARIPHFYYDYYVFQYSTGFSAASALAEKIVHGSQEDKDKYLDYLKAGNSDYPLNVIKKAGVDMEKEDYLNAAFAVFERRLDEFEALVEKLGLA